jgi:hypothetical protein
MTQKRMEKIIKRDKRRKVAQGIGALFGTITSLLGIMLVFGKDLKGKDKK